MLESQLEKKCTELAKSSGWLAFKFTSPSNRGVPDRIYLKNGVCKFVEFKRKGCVPTPLQNKRIAQLREQGFLVFVVDSLEVFEDVIA